MGTARNGGRFGLLTKSIIAVVVSVALFAGCGGNTPEPSTEPNDTPPASEPAKAPKSLTATPTNSTPSQSGPLEDQLRGAAEGYYGAVVEMWKTMDVAPLEKVADPGACNACMNYANLIQKHKSDGNHFTNVKKWTVGSDFKITKEGAVPEATFTLTTGGGQLVNKSGKPVKTVKSATSKHRMIFRKDKGSGKWLIVDDLDA